MYKLCFYVPESHVEIVKNAVFQAGAGRYENYDCCAWQVRGQGQFRPLAGSRPFLGSAGTGLERVEEYRVEMICAEEVAPAVLAALCAAHPYETPAYDCVRILDVQPVRPCAADPEARLLVVEDNAQLLRIERDMLQTAFPGILVDSAANAEEAEVLLAERTYDVVVTDLNLGAGENGLQLCSRLAAAAGSGAPVPAFVFCSAVKGAIDGVQDFCRTHGGVYLMKPFRMAMLEDAVRTVLSSRARDGRGG